MDVDDSHSDTAASAGSRWHRAPAPPPIITGESARDTHHNHNVLFSLAVFQSRDIC